MTRPLVSCIMPTADRRAFVEQAVWYFLRQDYEPRELLVLDDGSKPVDDLVPEDERIRYVRLEERMPLGAKRNLACELSHGELVAHWDDDDWIRCDRLSAQVAALEASGADVCGAGDLLHYDLGRGAAWLYRRGDRPVLAGCTLLYRRSAWAERPFQPVASGEDSAFVASFARDRLHALDDPPFYVALIHPGNTGKKRLGDEAWHPEPLDRVSRRLALDRAFYGSLRNGGAKPVARRERVSTRVTLASHFMVCDGYGSMAEYLALGLARAGADVDVVPLLLREEGLTDEFLELARAAQPSSRSPTLYFSPPGPQLERFAETPDLFVNTMWESDALPPEWIEPLNRARAVLVPTRWMARVCRESGVRVPVEVVPEGIDPAVYHYEERPERPGLTTLIVGTNVERKHTREGVAAWKRAFAGDPDARLLIKAHFQQGSFETDDPRIRFADVNEPTRGIASWYRRADVLLALGNEGFGLPLVEGMATGLPVVALSSEGQGDVCADAGELVLAVDPVRYEPHVQPPYGVRGVHGVPAVEDVAARLHWVDDHRGEARELGRAASAWALRHRNVWDKAPAVLDVLEEHVVPRRPLRRRRTLWVPTAGVADYVARLAGALEAVRVVRERPDLRSARLLHAQDAPGADESELARAVREGKLAGVPVAVTEHEVRAGARAWEGEADALVALTESGAALLRARRPETRVETIGLGCPTWFPPRKRVPGSVLATYGSLERRRGLWQLADALRRLPGVELLVCAPPTDDAVERDWAEATEGLRVRRFFASPEWAARRLAAEADALVYWYDDPPAPTASGAVRVGLATGVPVLTSPTAWFEDAREATFQPTDLVEGARRLLADAELRRTVVAAARAFCHDHDWTRIAARHEALWRTLESG